MFWVIAWTLIRVNYIYIVLKYQWYNMIIQLNYLTFEIHQLQDTATALKNIIPHWKNNVTYL